jgi:hypothetical protein
MPSVITCNGVVTLLADGSPTCSTGWTTQVAAIPFDLSQLDPTVATAMFGAGFALFITPWATAWGISQLFKLLR